MKLQVVIDGETYEVEVKKRDGDLILRLGEEEEVFHTKKFSPNEYTIFSDEERIHFFYERKKRGNYLIAIDNCNIYVVVTNSRNRFIGRGESGDESVREVVAPMPGKVVRVEVKEGEEVKKDQVLLAIEAMKMENLIKSPRKGKVKKVFVKEGDSVEARAVLIVFE